MSETIMNGKGPQGKSITAMNDRMFELRNKLTNVNKLIADRSHSQHLNPEFNLMTTVIEEDEL